MSDHVNANLELPVEGFPINGNMVRDWFERRHGRLPSELELGRMMIAMAAREASPPRQETGATAPGWSIGPDSHPPSRT